MYLNLVDIITQTILKSYNPWCVASSNSNPREIEFSFKMALITCSVEYMSRVNTRVLFSVGKHVNMPDRSLRNRTCHTCFLI